MRPHSVLRFWLVLSTPLLGIGCSLNETGLEVGDASTKNDVVSASDVSTLDTAPLVNWCSTAGAGHDFCADFDSSLIGNEPGAWCNASSAPACNATEMGGTLARDTAASTSPPASANAKTTLGGPSSQALLTRDFPGDLHPLKLAFDLRVDAAGANKAALASITLEDDGTNSHRIALNGGPEPDGGTGVSLTLVEFPVAGAARSTTLASNLVVGKFARIEITVGVAPNIVTVTVDGGSPLAATVIDGSTSAMGRALQLGLAMTPADTWQTHVDDVTFDFTK